MKIGLFTLGQVFGVVLVNEGNADGQELGQVEMLFVRSVDDCGLFGPDVQQFLEKLREMKKIFSWLL